jgi:hypothetical protein
MRATALEEELEKAESPEESLHTNSKIMLQQIENTDLDEEKLLAAVEHGADSVTGRLKPGLICLWPIALPDVCLQNIILTAAAGIDFCITCGIMHGGTNGIISGPGTSKLSVPTPAPPTTTTTPPPPPPPGLNPGSTVAFRGGHSRRYCADEYNTIKCNRNGIGAWEKFYVGDGGSGKRGLRGGNRNRWCADESNTIKCNRNGIGAWEKFTVGGGGGTISLKGGRNGRWCADEYNGIKCNRNAIGAWEKFTVSNAR